MIRKFNKTFLSIMAVILFATSFSTISNAVFTNPTSTNSNYNRTYAYNYMTNYTENLSIYH